MTAAGWYQDPRNPRMMRWWDGQAWTEHTAGPDSQAGHGGQNGGDWEAALRSEIDELQSLKLRLEEEVLDLREAVLLQDVGIYRYTHRLDGVLGYQTALDAIRLEIKDTIKSGLAVTTAKRWLINGSEKDGQRMLSDFAKLLLHSYNVEADDLVATMKPYALEKAVKRLQKHREFIAKLARSMQIEVTDAYHELRVRELELTADYLTRVAEQKEQEREDRARLKEEEAARREMEREQARLEKERAHYESVINALRARGDENAALQAEAKLAEVDASIEGIERRAANVRAGYVYVISNLGSFGSEVVKIGLTRRLDPMDRVRELGDASVPFRFDVHALFFSEDAVAVESELHRIFADRRVNMVNAHREFFFATPHEVREALERLGVAQLVQFTEEPEALEWHQSTNARAPMPRTFQSLSPQT